MAFGHFLLGSHNFMVMALGSCVTLSKVPLQFVTRLFIIVLSLCMWQGPCAEGISILLLLNMTILSKQVHVVKFSVGQDTETKYLPLAP
jgi:hypothetical protein